MSLSEIETPITSQPVIEAYLWIHPWPPTPWYLIIRWVSKSNVENPNHSQLFIRVWLAIQPSSPLESNVKSRKPDFQPAGCWNIYGNSQLNIDSMYSSVHGAPSSASLCQPNIKAMSQFENPISNKLVIETYLEVHTWIPTLKIVLCMLPRLPRHYFDRAIKKQIDNVKSRKPISLPAGYYIKPIWEFKIKNDAFYV